LNNGWDCVAKRLYIKFQGKRIVFSHEPINYDNYYDLNIHGHIHNALREFAYENERYGRIPNDKQYLVALENINYQPILLKTYIEKLIN
jgi:calcineurin-like phosphoesterase family protein